MRRPPFGAAVFLCRRRDCVTRPRLSRSSGLGLPALHEAASKHDINNGTTTRQAHAAPRRLLGNHREGRALVQEARLSRICGLRRNAPRAGPRETDQCRDDAKKRRKPLLAAAQLGLETRQFGRTDAVTGGTHRRMGLAHPGRGAFGGALMQEADAATADTGFVQVIARQAEVAQKVIVKVRQLIDGAGCEQTHEEGHFGLRSGRRPSVSNQRWGGINSFAANEIGSCASSFKQIDIIDSIKFRYPTA